MVARWSHFSGCFWLFLQYFGKWQGPMNDDFTQQLMELQVGPIIDGGDTQTLLVVQKFFNFMHSQAVAAQKL